MPNTFSYGNFLSTIFSSDDSVLQAFDLDVTLRLMIIDNDQDDDDDDGMEEEGAVHSDKTF